jgi:hypothetical protein
MPCSRERYRNGDALHLKSKGCDSCTPSVIMGHLCHDWDCPDKWRDYEVKCRGCGQEFFRSEPELWHCDDCLFGESQWETNGGR